MAYLSEANDDWLKRAVLFGCFQRLQVESAVCVEVGEDVRRHRGRVQDKASSKASADSKGVQKHKPQ